MTSSHSRSGQRLPKPGCVAYIPFVEGSGTPHDFSKEGNDATITGGTWTSAPESASDLGYGVSLDGTDDYIEIPDDASLDTGGPLSIRLVFKTPEWDSGNNEQFLTKTESGNNPGWDIGLGTAGKLTTPASDVDPLTDLNQNRVVELVAATNSNKGWTFIDGALANDTPGGTVGSSNGPVRIGAHWSGNYFTEMTVYSVEIYDRLLGVEEISGWDAGWSQFGGINGQTRWYDSAWAEQAHLDPDRGTGKLPVLSSAPSNPETGEYYLDDGTNTSSGNLAIRVWDGAAWVDQN